MTEKVWQSYVARLAVSTSCADKTRLLMCHMIFKLSAAQNTPTHPPPPRYAHTHTNTYFENQIWVEFRTPKYSSQEFKQLQKARRVKHCHSRRDNDFRECIMKCQIADFSDDCLWGYLWHSVAVSILGKQSADCKLIVWFISRLHAELRQ